MADLDPEIKKCFAEFEELGETNVRVKHAPKDNVLIQDHRVKLAAEWCRLQQESRDLAASSKRDAREERTLAIAEEALRIASEDLEAARSSAASARAQARWALYAAIIATVAAVIASKEDILRLIFNLL